MNIFICIIINSSSAAWASTVEADLAAVKRELAAADTSQVYITTPETRNLYHNRPYIIIGLIPETPNLKSSTLHPRP